MITFGIETEFLVLKNNVAPLHKEIEQLFLKLESLGWCKNYFDPKRGSITCSRETNFGYIKIYPDFSSTILEVAYPPLASCLDLINIKNEIEVLLKQELETLGISMESIGFKDILIPESAIYNNHPRYSWFKNQQINFDHPLKHQYFTAKIASLHIHLNAETCKHSNDLYDLEYLVPLLFSNSKTSQFQCARGLSWIVNKPDGYKNWGIPSDQVSNESEEIRNYSFIVKRNFGTIEFRSMCMQNDTNDVLAAVAFRNIQSLYQSSEKNTQPASKSFIDAATHNVKPERYTDDINWLTEMLNQIHPTLALYLDQKLARLKSPSNIGKSNE